MLRASRECARHEVFRCRDSGPVGAFRFSFFPLRLLIAGAGSESSRMRGCAPCSTAWEEESPSAHTILEVAGGRQQVRGSVARAGVEHQTFRCGLLCWWSSSSKKMEGTHGPWHGATGRLVLAPAGPSHPRSTCTANACCAASAAAGVTRDSVPSKHGCGAAAVMGCCEGRCCHAGDTGNTRNYYIIKGVERCALFLHASSKSRQQLRCDAMPALELHSVKSHKAVLYFPGGRAKGGGRTGHPVASQPRMPPPIKQTGHSGGKIRIARSNKGMKKKKLNAGTSSTCFRLSQMAVLVD